MKKNYLVVSFLFSIVIFFGCANAGLHPPKHYGNNEYRIINTGYEGGFMVMILYIKNTNLNSEDSNFFNILDCLISENLNEIKSLHSTLIVCVTNKNYNSSDDWQGTKWELTLQAVVKDREYYISKIISKKNSIKHNTVVHRKIECLKSN